MLDKSQILFQQNLYLSYLPHVRKQFGNLPGVEMIGLGAKEKAGGITEEWAFRFYVNKKRKIEEIPADEIIPAAIFGIQTDVLSHFEKETLICDSTALSVDSKSYRDQGIRGGIPIRNDYFDNDQPSGYGTLGVLARRKADNALVGLTCAHVVNAASQDLTQINTKIGQPKYWITCCCCPHGYIGDVAKATFNTDLDCAIIAIHEDITEKVTTGNSEKKIEGLATDITGAAAIVCFDTVSKRGRATGVTTGKVSEIAYGTNQMLIERTGTAGGPFACHGDSGAVVVNSSGQVVGLIVAAARSDMKRTIVTHIKPVMAELGITIAGTDITTIGEPLGGGPTGCELLIWPGGQTDTAMNPVEEFASTDFGLTGAVNWDVSNGAAGAVIVQTGNQQATGLEKISVRYDLASHSKNATDTVHIQAIGAQTVTKFRTIFCFTPKAVNTSNPLDSLNTKKFAATGGTTNLAGVAVPAGAGDWFMAKAEIIYDITPQNIVWSSGSSITFVTGAPAGVKGNIIARRQTKFTKGEQVNGTPNRVHTDQPAFALTTTGSTADDFQAPTNAAPNNLFRLANEGFDPTNLRQGYLRADYRDYLEFHNGTAWVRITGFTDWFANLTGGLNAAPPPLVTAAEINTIGAGTTTVPLPNQRPVINAGADQEIAMGGGTVTLKATRTDADLDALTTHWTRTSGAAVTLSGGGVGNPVTFTAPASDGPIVFSAVARDNTNGLSHAPTPPNFESTPDTVVVNVVETLVKIGGNARLCVNNEEVFNAASFSIGAGALNWDVTTGSPDAIIVEADGASIAPVGTLNGATTIRVNFNNTSIDATRANTVVIRATNPANGRAFFKRRTVNAVGFNVTTSVAAGAAPSNALNATTWGLTFPENVVVTICAYRVAGNWQAALLTVRGNYSLQSRLLAGVAEVTGPPPGNTTEGNYCAQITELDSLFGTHWYMLSAVTAHEQVHANHFLPALNDATVLGVLRTAIEGLTVPHVAGMNQAGAIAAITGSAAFATALVNAQANWLTRILLLAANDHGPGGVFSRTSPTSVAELAVVNPMIARICAHRTANGWAACPPLCP
ncbi:S1 family peptidase [Dyadobacter sp. NIV53]|uniref:S1 family peptidase n=1 Tax=Dyadobacter sp. NIV53 TaxID=2861765 RepID=UPI001C88A8A4|nr:S1 family peptidase [Dyadobacter sp. NIV53]